MESQRLYKSCSDITQSSEATQKSSEWQNQDQDLFLFKKNSFYKKVLSYDNFEVEEKIFQWFKMKGIAQGNPEEVQQQYRDTKKKSVMQCLDFNDQKFFKNLQSKILTRRKSNTH